MEELNILFRTDEALPFREADIDKDFKVNLSGMVEVYDYDAAVFGEGGAEQDAIREKVLELLPGCLLKRTGKELMTTQGAREELRILLKNALSDAGVTAEVILKKIEIARESIEEYRCHTGGQLMNKLFPAVTPDRTLEEEHGPLIGFALSYSSHGMMMGTSSYSSQNLDWNRDGSITLTYTSNGRGTSLNQVYNVKPEIARKMRDYVAEKHLAALSKQEIPTIMMADNFTSASFSMTFDDSGIGGSPYEMMSVNCGPAGMTFRTIENELSAILEECRDTGECIASDSKKTDGMIGFLGGSGGIVISSSPSGVGGAKAPEIKSVIYWTCSNCGYNKNSGKFCTECGCRH
ncbi:MAG: hypothetical protein J5950_06980 [Clostridia bacterium]|nr:hypothetical protein [Clostridia bacterium]